VRFGLVTASCFLRQLTRLRRELASPHAVNSPTYMRGAIIVFIIGVIAGALALNYLKQRNEARASASTASSTAATNPSFLDQARDVAVSTKDSIGEKLEDWHLTGDDIKRDLGKGGEVVRTKAKTAGEAIATTATKARIVGTIKAKYALDKELSARSIEVSSDEGKVTLRGTVANEALIGKAVGLALDTDGVVEVKSLLNVPAKQ
jgi:osmotically-inducible protein OsmY